MKYIEIGNIRMITRTQKGFLLTSAPDTCSGDIQTNVINYAGCDGEEIRDIFYKSRAFSIEGFILNDTERGYLELRRKLIRELIPKNEYPFTYHDGFSTYKATVNIDGNVTFGRVVGRHNGSFLINVIVPDFYFKGQKGVFAEVYREKDLIQGDVTLPAVFTERIMEATVINDGDVPAYPLFTLNCFAVQNNSIVISNDATGEKLMLNYTPTEGEKIVIDCENYKITSNVNGNIIRYLSADSCFFTIGKGSVRLSCLTNGVAVSVEFYERYSGV